MELREEIAREIESFMLGRVGSKVCENAADAILAIPEIADALEFWRSAAARAYQTGEMERD